MVEAVSRSNIPKEENIDMKSGSYKIAGRISILNAFMPLIFFAALKMWVNFDISEKFLVFLIPIVLIQTFLTMYTWRSLRILLNERYMINDANIILKILFYAFPFMVLSVIQILYHYFVNSPADFVNVVEIIINSYIFAGISEGSINPYGILLILLAIKILIYQETIDLLMKIYAYVILTYGIMLMTALLGPYGYIVSFVSYILLGKILMRESKPVEFV